MNCETFIDNLKKESNKDFGLCPPPIKAQKGLKILIEHFLGEDWYVSMPVGVEQVNTEAIYDILKRYPNQNIFQKILCFIKSKCNYFK